MPMTEKAALLHTRHTRKEAAFWRRADNCLKMGYRPYTRRYERLCYLATMHGNAAHAIYNCPDSWERSETDRKLAEIKAYLGSPLYDEWLEAGAAENFEQYVAEEYDKLFPGTNETHDTVYILRGVTQLALQSRRIFPERLDFWNSSRTAISNYREARRIHHDPRTIRERLHDETGADLGRMNNDLRNGG